MECPDVTPYDALLLVSFGGPERPEDVVPFLENVTAGRGIPHGAGVGSTQAPILNVNDFQCFLTRFAAADAYANCDGSTTIPVLNINDFTCFLSSYAAGCP